MADSGGSLLYLLRFCIACIYTYQDKARENSLHVYKLCLQPQKFNEVLLFEIFSSVCFTVAGNISKFFRYSGTRPYVYSRQLRALSATSVIIGLC